MRLLRPLCLLGSLLCVPVIAGAQFTTLDTGRTIITAMGSARSTYTPDHVTVTLLLEPQAMSVEEAGNRIAAVERAVLDTLRHFNLPANAIQVFNSGVLPYRSNMTPSAGPSFTGRASVRVELAHPEMLPAITSAALAKGASFVSSPIYTLSAMDSARRALVPQAFQQARREAETLAAAAGGRLGRLLDLSEGAQPFNYAEQAAQTMIAGGMIYDNGQRSIPTSSLVVNVTTRWLLVGGPR